MIPESARAKGKLHLRYEDVAQDGRLLLEAIPVSLGVVWRELVVAPEVRRDLLAQGVIPILTRFEIEGGPGPFAVETHLDVEGGFALACAEGDPRRILLDMDATVTGRKGRTNLPPPDDAGTEAVAGTLRAEHVFTRPFASAEQRRVTSLELGGATLVPRARRAWRPPQTALDVAGARALDASFVEDPVVWPMGLTHTDSNQHINSLVYPRLFEEVALRRISAHGRSTSVLARALDIAFRRPSFAGERLRAIAKLHEHEGRAVCTGAFFGDGEPLDPAKARVYVRMTLE